MDSEEAVREIVRESPGISGVQLVSRVISQVYKKTGVVPDVDLVELLDQMVTQGKLVEVEYVAPSMFYRIKSLYFEPSTKITVKNSA